MFARRRQLFRTVREADDGTVLAVTLVGLAVFGVGYEVGGALAGAGFDLPVLAVLVSSAAAGLALLAGQRDD